MKLRSKLVAAVAGYLAADHSVPVPIHRETGDDYLEPPYAVVRISTADPLVPGEPIWNLTVLVAVTQLADLTPAEDAEAIAESTFAPVDFTPRDGEGNAEALNRLPEWNGTKFVPRNITPAANSLLSWDGSKQPTAIATSSFESAGAAASAQAYAVQRSNHTGTQAISTITGTGPFATGTNAAIHRTK